MAGAGLATANRSHTGLTPGHRALGQAVYTHVPLSPSSIHLVAVQAGKVTVGLASH